MVIVLSATKHDELAEIWLNYYHIIHFRLHIHKSNVTETRILSESVRVRLTYYITNDIFCFWWSGIRSTSRTPNQPLFLVDDGWLVGGRTIYFSLPVWEMVIIKRRQSRGFCVCCAVASTEEEIYKLAMHITMKLNTRHVDDRWCLVKSRRHRSVLAPAMNIHTNAVKASFLL